MTHKLEIEELNVSNQLIEVWYYFEGNESSNVYYVIRDTFDMWLEATNQLKGTDTTYCQIINDTIDTDWQMEIDDVYKDYCLLKELVVDYLLKNKLITP
jgi:predicted lipoprotein